MSEYLERETAINIADHAILEHLYDKDSRRPETYSDYNQGWSDACNHIRARLEYVLAADVAPVVRCMDCKYWHRALLKSEDGSPVDFGICDFMKDDIDTDEEDFCSRGEKA